MSIDQIVPVNGCCVSYTGEPNIQHIGVVRQTRLRDIGAEATVDWHRPTRKMSTLDVSQLRSGFSLKMEVMDAQTTIGRESLGCGEVVALRRLGDRDQVLVDYPESGIRTWMPFQNLRMIKGARHRFFTGDTGTECSAERLRLRLLARALEVWNENTGTLAQFDIDPLPHQIHLVHHILASGNLNWLIADDVGLGKTIETGMLLAALRQRSLINRVLLLTPAGLTKQWKDELFYKFGFESFEIFGEDFFINEPRQWKMHDFVIGSMDRLKQESNLEKLLTAPDWDLIIVDEAHRLSRRQYGMKFDSSDRFQLAQAVRGKSRSMILLTATPHQGMQDKFVSLLELLRPELRTELQTLSINPEILGDMVYRNYKADVTDANGNFVFKGKSVHSIRIQSSEEAMNFDRALQNYFRQGYAAGGRAGGVVGRAIGFVMTIYRKLAASSTEAILSALHRRHERLRTGNALKDASDESDERYVGEWEEKQSGEQQEFFDGEIALLKELIHYAEGLKKSDQKLLALTSQILPRLLDKNSKEKILIFTEYRTTQEYLRGALLSLYGATSVELIHGSMNHDERGEAISRFERDGQFLISTEAGGEGINLQRQCHVMINYDLPWNPMRLVQRVGRLYRYGQGKPVLVFNIHATGTMDEGIIELMYQRLQAVVSDLARVQSHEFNDGLADDILGDVAEMLDVGEILASATESGIQRTQQRIDEALERARDAAQMQRELFQHAARFNAEELEGGLRIGLDHLSAFAEGMFRLMKIEISDRLLGDKVWKIRVPEELRKELGWRSSVLDVTFDRLIATTRPNTTMLDLNNPLMALMLKTARLYEFGGLSAAICDFEGHALLAGILRWQDDQGRRLRQAFTAFVVGKDGTIDVNPARLDEWLLSPAVDGVANPEREKNESTIKLAETAANKILGTGSNQFLHPENLQWIAGAWLSHNDEAHLP